MNRVTVTVLVSSVYGKVACAVLKALKVNYRVCYVNPKKISDIYYAQDDYNFKIDFSSHENDYYIRLAKHINIPLRFMKDISSVNLNYEEHGYEDLQKVFLSDQGNLVKTKTETWISDYVFTDLTFKHYDRDNISQICYTVKDGITEIKKLRLDDIPEDVIKSEFYLSNYPRKFNVNGAYMINPHHLPVYKDPFHTIACTIFAFVGMISDKEYTNSKEQKETNLKQNNSMRKRENRNND